LPAAAPATQQVSAAAGGKAAVQGQIKRLVRDRGFGFIRPEGGTEDVFFHSSATRGVMFDELSEGQTVEFEEQADPRDAKRSRAINVRLAGE
jgi:CspA family cold shock protein